MGGAVWAEERRTCRLTVPWGGGVNGLGGCWTMRGVVQEAGVGRQVRSWLLGCWLEPWCSLL